jgi:hypothetical protein
MLAGARGAPPPLLPRSSREFNWETDFGPNPLLAAGVIVAIVVVGLSIALFAAASPAGAGDAVLTLGGLLLMISTVPASLFTMARASLNHRDSSDPLFDPLAHVVRQVVLGFLSLYAIGCLVVAAGAPGGLGVGVPLVLFIFVPGALLLGAIWLIGGLLLLED